MKKAFLRKIVTGVVVLATIMSTAPLGVSAATITTNDFNYYNLIAKGILNAGWVKDNGNWYYLDNNGVKQTGVIKVNNKIYCLDKSGVMKTGTVVVNSKTYKCSSNGQVTSSKVPSVDKVFDANNKVIKDNKQNSTVTKTTDTNVKTNIGNSSTTNNTTTQTNNNTQVLGTVDVQGLPQLPKTYSISVQAAAEDQILKLMNEKRVEAGLQPLTIDNTLKQVARYKSNHMIQYNYFDHVTPEGTKWTNWLQTIGYKYTTTGENIAYNTYDAVELFNQWWNSPGHRANMMNASYTKVGIGVVLGNNKYMGTQEFSN